MLQEIFPKKGVLPVFIDRIPAFLKYQNTLET
jgi:hypothetical protein